MCSQVFKYDDLTDNFKVQLLYDDMFTTIIPGITKGYLDHTHDTTPATFGDINGQELSLPNGVRPFRRVVLFVAYSAYNLALNNPRPHQVATETSHTIQEWAEMFERSHSVVPTESPLMTSWRTNRDA
mmetsp:Transcript_12424/g.16966  ORF Transcript_12424/g.16966 Transcript_12424/m.16966 type:complete len:128 (+) Transcript_12424:244-627(+)